MPYPKQKDPRRFRRFCLLNTTVAGFFLFLVWYNLCFEKEKLDGKHLQYDEITDVTTMEHLGIDQVPVLQIDDGPLMVFSEAVKYVNQMEDAK